MVKKTSLLHIPVGGLKHLDSKGNIVWENDRVIDNILHNEGEKAIISAYFATTMTGFGTAPANVYLGLDSRASVTESDTLASLTGEPSGNGYARVACSTASDGTAKTGVAGADFYINASSNAYGAESKTVTFTCTTTAWSAVTHLFMATSNDASGKLICTLDLSASRTLQVGDSLQASMNIYLSESGEAA